MSLTTPQRVAPNGLSRSQRNGPTPHKIVDFQLPRELCQMDLPDPKEMDQNLTRWWIYNSPESCAKWTCQIPKKWTKTLRGGGFTTPQRVAPSGLARSQRNGPKPHEVVDLKLPRKLRQMDLPDPKEMDQNLTRWWIYNSPKSCAKWTCQIPKK